MKNKNPLYVVKGKEVTEVRSIFDLVVKKLNLEPIISFLQNLLKILLEQIENYPTFIAVKSKIDEIVAMVSGLRSKFA